MWYTESINIVKPGYNYICLCPFEYCVWGWRKAKVYGVKVATREALLGLIWDTADGIISSQRKLQRATRAVHNLAATCAFAGGGVVEKLPQKQFNFMKLSYIYTLNTSNIVYLQFYSIYYSISFLQALSS